MRPSFLYIIENLLNNKLYVGVSVNPQERWTTHKSIAKKLNNNAKHLHYAMSKHLSNLDNVFKFTIILAFSSEEEAYQEEIFWIRYLKEMNVKLYNKTDGAEHGPAMFGSDNPFYGKKHTEETIKMLSGNMIGKYSGDKNFFFGKSFKGENHPLFGTKRPQSVLDSLSKTHKGKIISEEIREKMRLSHIGKHKGVKNPMFGKNGENNPNHGISDKLALEIYNKYYNEKISVKNLVVEYKISRSTIQRIIYSKDRFEWLKKFLKEGFNHKTTI